MQLCSFILGGFLGLLILLFRHWVPESPRWLATHGRGREAEEIVASVEREVTADPTSLPALVGRKQRLRIREYTPWSEIWHAVAHQYPTRSILGFTLMVTQAFLYNAIFGAIVGTGSRTALFGAYCFAGAVMLVAAIVEVFLGVKAERQSLESIATPLSEVVQREPVPVT